ncbi:hypothetical protein K7A41_07750 [Sphingobacterium sp. InxBP1]|uniref:hypothetical protein n=1 Tax=Sphingobacterium sp. InxBP1 TaxID=2870328 RepID=UPI0022435246|nr:hypothetical protein [Sphingobacterium sp. InxBP1]MCW8311112.1 hypothetical protein [Sphingobacterium sp. InxBP1]
MKAIFHYAIRRNVLLLLVVLLHSLHLLGQTPVTAKVDAPGWKRVAYVSSASGRGFGKVTLFTSGGATTPNYLDIEWFKDWQYVGGLSLKTNSNAGYWNGARITYDQDTAFIEVNFTVAIASLQTFSDTYGWNAAKLFSGVLPDGGGTVRAEAKGGRFNVGDYFYVAHNGRVGVGTTVPKETLSVNGKIRAHEIKVETSNWPDYVFKKDYNLMPLDSLEQFITTYGHLPDIPSAKEVSVNGIQLGEMVNKLLKKNEELTLHLIEKDKQIQSQAKRLENLENLVRHLVKE